MSLPTDVANNVLDAINGVDTFDAPTLPMKLRLLTVNGDADTPGTELATGHGGGSGAGYTAGGLAVALTAASYASTTITATATWDNMPACTLVGAEIWDSAGTPKRYQYAQLTVPKTIGDGDAMELPATNLSNTMDG